MKKSGVEIYSIEKFHVGESVSSVQYKVEIFDANRHFHVIYPHRHDFYEILFLTQGSGIHEIDGIAYPVEPPTIFFLSPGQIHNLDLSKDVKGFIFLFTSEYYSENKADKDSLLEYPFFYNLSNETPPLHLKNNTEVHIFKSLFENGVQECNTNMSGSSQIVVSLLDLILAYAKRYYPVVQAEKQQKGKLLVKRLKQLVEEKCLENLSIKQYADLLAVTPNHLNETVKLYTGNTASHLIDQKMIMEIKRLLKHTELSIIEISHYFNFIDQSYFSKYFKKHTGSSPGVYRKSE
jgi:AraC family transcriptional activator of pobA